MGNGDYGYSQAFNIKTNHGQAVNNEIEDMKYAEGQRKQNEAMAMAKSKMMQDDFEFQNGSNEYDAAIIKQEAQKAISEVGAMYKDPRAYTDPAFGLQIKLKKQSIKNTAATLRSAAWKQAASDYGKFATEALKNPTAYNLDQLKEFRTKMDNYGKDANGNPMPESEMQALVFTPPEEIPDFDKKHLEISRSLKPTQYDKWHNGNRGAFMGTVPDETIWNEAKQLYAGNKSGYDYHYKGADPLQKIHDALKTGAPVDAHFGERADDWKSKMDYEYRLKSALKGGGQGSVDPYIPVILNSRDVPVPDEDMAATFGSTPTVQYMTPKGLVTESGNRFHWTRLTDKNYRGTDSKGNVIPYKKDFLKTGSGYIYKPLEFGKELGVLEDTKLWGEELAVKPEYKGDYEIFTQPDGKKVLKIKAATEINANSAEATTKYNSHIHRTTKQREGVGNEETVQGSGGGPQVGYTQDGYQYMGGDPSSSNSWKKL